MLAPPPSGSVRRHRLPLALLALCGAGCPRGWSCPPEPAATLEIGDRAPDIAIDDWVHPGAVRPVAAPDAFEPGTIYVLEFWATWCPHSRAAVPLLAALQERHADDGVVVIGLALDVPGSLRGFLTDSDPDVRDLATVAGRYCLAVDPDGSVQESYMDAIRESAVPTAFIVGREGLVEWIGHPADLGEPLGRIVAGTWDRAAFAARRARLRAAAACVVDARGLLADGRTAEAVALLDRFTTDHAADAEALNEAAWLLVDRVGPGLLPDEVLAVAQRAAERSVGLDSTDGNHLDTLAHVLALRGDVDAAVDAARRAVATGGDAGRFRDHLADLEAEAANRNRRPGR